MKQFSSTFFAVLFAFAVAVFLLQQFTKNDKIHARHIAFLTQGLADATHYRIAIAEKWQSEGELPCTNKQLGINGNGVFTSRALSGVEVSDCGQLTLYFDVLTGVQDGTIVLQAEIVEGAFGKEMEWHCRTSDYPTIAEHMPQCDYTDKNQSGDGSAVNKTEGALADKLAKAFTQGNSEADSESAIAGKSASCAQGVALYHPVFTDEMIGDAPSDRLVTIGPTRESAYFFTEIIGARGQQVVHRWFHDNKKVADVVFSVKGDRWPTWSSQLLGLLGNGLLRVEVLVDNCIIGQQSVLFADREIKSVVENIKHGWMRPTQAMETVLVQQATETAADADRRSAADALTENGDTLLIEALRNGNEQEALWLIKTPDEEALNEFREQQRQDVAKYMKHADPFLKGADGSTPLQLAKAMSMPAVVAALESSITKVSSRSRRRNAPRNSSRWTDPLIEITNDPTIRFDNGDTPLHRAVRTNNERAVATMLALGVVNPTSADYKPKSDVYAYDRAGQQPLEIARANGFTGVEHLLLIAQKHLVPTWAVSRASFASKMSGKEPGECRKVAFDDESTVHFFAELAGLKGRTVEHVWYLNDAPIHREQFNVTDNLFASVSTRRFLPSEVGRWKVAVRLANDRLLATHFLTYKKLNNITAKNRANYIGTTDCELGLGTLYALARANAPLAEFDRLFEKGLKFNQRRSQFKDVFMIAHKSGNITLVRWFLERGFDLERQVVHRKSPMTVAANNGQAPMMLYLLNQGAELTKENGERLLRYAAFNDQVGVAKILLDHGVDPNEAFRDGAVPLSTSLERCALNVSVLLLQSGANRKLLLSEHNPELPANQSGTLRERAGKCIKYKTWSVDNPAVEYILGLESI